MQNSIFHPMPDDFYKKCYGMTLTYMLATGLSVAVLCFFLLGVKQTGAKENVPPPKIAPKVACASPKPLDELIAMARPVVPTPTPHKVPESDVFIDKYAKKFGKSAGDRNHLKQLLHCLIYRESGYDTNKGRGDSGLAIGPMQFHQGTWNGFRKIMIARGITDKIGSPTNLEQAISTTAWAISDGRSGNWGPIVRRVCE